MRSLSRNICRRAANIVPVLAACLIFQSWLAPTAALAVSCPEEYGDIDGDGVINIVDVQCLILTALWQLGGSADPQPPCIGGLANRADLNCDGDVTITDIQITIQLTFNLPLSPLIDSTGLGCADTCKISEEPKVVIAEVLYDSVGPDNNTFLEIAGPPGLSLQGYSLVGVNGNGGVDYQTVPLTGTINANGLYVVGNPNADPWILSVSDQLNVNVNYQNGPDSVHLRKGTTVVDAVGYGTFTASDVFAGEGSPIPGPAPGYSIGRDSNHTDTNNNVVDFVAYANPTPGVVNGLTNAPPIAQLACPSGVIQGQAASFSGADSSDLEGPIANYSFAWGDGTPASSGTTAVVQHIFANAGAFQVVLTVTDNGGLTATASCTVQVAPANTPPTAALQCPSGGTVGEQLTFNASGSTDTEGPIASYIFNFGDGSSPLATTNPIAQRSYSASGSFSVQLTVTDQGGLSATASCTVSITGATNPPYVQIIKPFEGTSITHGQTLSVLTNALGQAGKTIASVDLTVNGQPIGQPDTIAPYEHAWVVPLDTPNGSVLSVRALATDSAGVSALSAERTVQVINQPPVAAFSAAITGALTVSLDASLSSDPETPLSGLQFRWDYDGDGTWDTDWSGQTSQSHAYASMGTYLIRLQVRDNIGQTAIAEKSVSLSLLNFVAGTVETTTWVGTVIVTGTITVPSGHKLTVAPGTTVLFVNIDQNNDGVGDYNIIVNGAIDVQGTEASPVIFTTYGPELVPRAWGGIRVVGPGSSLSYVTVLYADTGIQVQSPTNLDHVTVKYSQVGILATGSNNNPVNLTHVTLEHNNTCGLEVQAASVFCTNGFLAHNQNGACVRSAGLLDISDSTATENAEHGIFYNGNARGLATRNQITFNGREGVLVFLSQTQNVPKLWRNNIYGNAVHGAHVVATTNLIANSTVSGTGTTSSSVFTAPGGASVRFVRYTFSQSFSTTSLGGNIRANNQSGAIVGSVSTDGTNWLWFNQNAATGVLAQVIDNTTSGNASLAINRVVYYVPGASAEIAYLGESQIDLRQNFVGEMNEVLSKITRGVKTNGQIEGFRGAPFGPEWTMPPYWGGETISGNVSWSGEVFVTGNLDIGNGGLTVAPGTHVRVVPFDQDEDGNGDFRVRTLSTSSLTVGGPSGAPPIFELWGTPAVQAPRQWVGLVAVGPFDVERAVFRSAFTGLEVSKPGSLVDCLFEGNHLGLRGVNGADILAPNLQVKDNASTGVLLNGTGKLTCENCQIMGNTEHGVDANGGQFIATNSWFSGNGGHGIRARSGASLTVQDSTITQNTGAGVYLVSATNALLERNQIVFNEMEGVVAHIGAGTVAPVMRLCNVYGNALTSALVRQTVSLTATSTVSGVGTTSSSIYTAPAGTAIEMFRMSYSQSFNTTSLTGYVRESNGTILFTASSEATQWVPLSGSGNIQAQVVDNTTSGNASMSVGLVLLRTPGASRQITVVSDGPVADFRHNYLGAFPNVLSAVTRGGVTDVNVQGFMGVPFGPSYDRLNYRGGETLTSDTAWSGEQIFTGTITVAGGATLTLAPGSVVRMVDFRPSESDKGEIGLEVSGRLISDGTSGQPIQIQPFVMPAVPRSFDRVNLTGSGSSLKHTTIEGAAVGLRTTQSIAITDSLLRLNTQGLTPTGTNANPIELLRTRLEHNSAEGLFATSSAVVSASECYIQNNGEHGARITGSARLNISDSFVQNNTWSGLFYEVTGRGDVTRNLVAFNGWEGLRITASESATPPVVNYNNIYGNALTAARVVQTMNVSATSTVSGTGTTNSSLHASPGSALINAAWYTYSQSFSTTSLSGQLRSSLSGTTLASISQEGTRWSHFEGATSSTIMAVVIDNTTSGNASLAVTRVAFNSPTAVRQVSVLTSGPQVDLRFNYFGDFADPYTHVTVRVPQDVNIQGYVGLPFDNTWSTGNYVGGVNIAVPTQWSGTVHLTGQVTVTSSGSLTLAPGTQVLAHRIETTGSGLGTTQLVVNGPLTVNGTAQNPVVFTSPTQTPGDWVGVRVNQNSQWSHAVVEYGQTGIQVEGNASVSHSLNNVESRNHTETGILVTGSSIATILNSDSHDNGSSGFSLAGSSNSTLSWTNSHTNGGHGVTMLSNAKATADHVQVHHNAGCGFSLAASGNQLDLENSYVTNNDEYGVRTLNGKANIEWCMIAENGAGLAYFGGSTGTVKRNDISANDAEGLLLVSTVGTNPAPVVQENNFLSNCTSRGVVLVTSSHTASSTVSGTGTFNSSAYTAPGGAQLLAARASASMSFSSTSLTGYIMGPNSTTLHTFSNSVDTTYLPIASSVPLDSGIPSASTRVVDNTTSGNASVTLDRFAFRQAGANTQLAALTTAGTLDSRFNYWGVFPDVLSAILLSRSDAANIMGFVPFAYPDTGPDF